VDSVESALAAAKGNANRLELCSGLMIGGLTPSVALFQQVRKHTDLKIYALIRPRFGDFCYTDYEFEVMKQEVKMFLKLGADGISVGCLNSDGTLDKQKMEILIEEAGNMPVTFHRAFDVCQEPERVLEEVIALGVEAVLTSGQKNTALEGSGLLKTLAAKASDKIHIIAAGGVSKPVIEALWHDTKIKAYHMSGKKVLNSSMEYRNRQVNMGFATFNEYQILRTDDEEVRMAAELLKYL
jgi:copper homeostasis protein